MPNSSGKRASISYWIAIGMQVAMRSDSAAFSLATIEPSQVTDSSDGCGERVPGDDIVVCGRKAGNDQRLAKPDPRFERRSVDENGRFIRRLSDSATLGGGGPKGSAGVTLKVGF